MAVNFVLRVDLWDVQLNLCVFKSFRKAPFRIKLGHHVETHLGSFISFYFQLLGIFKKYFLFFERKRASMSRGGAERDGDRGSKAGSVLTASSPVWGLNSWTMRSQVELRSRVRRLTNWATQVPQIHLDFIHKQGHTHWYQCCNLCGFLLRATREGWGPGPSPWLVGGCLLRVVSHVFPPCARIQHALLWDTIECWTVLWSVPSY